MRKTTLPWLAGVCLAAYLLASARPAPTMGLPALKPAGLQITTAPATTTVPVSLTSTAPNPFTPTSTLTPPTTATATLTPTSTFSVTATPTATSAPTAALTPTVTPTGTATINLTLTPTPPVAVTFTLTPTSTPRPAHLRYMSFIARSRCMRKDPPPRCG